VSEQQTSKTGRGIQCVVVTPETTVFDMTAGFVSLPLDDGQRGVGLGHAPFIGRLGVGEVRVTPKQSGSQPARFFVQGGFVEVAHDTVTVITQRALAADAVDAQEARRELEKVQAGKAVGAEAIEARLKAAEAARALVRTASRNR
jgi:F-type H+-transporting ATPase subunit epsilon